MCRSYPSRMRLRILLLPLLAGVVQANSGPHPESKASPSEPADLVRRATEPRGATFVVERRADGAVGGAAAMMHARLAAVGNCVLVKSERGDEIVPVFGAGTASWDPRSRQLRYQNRHYAIGEIVPIGGGGINPAMIPTILRSPLVDVPSDCPTSRLWFATG
jgi:hypothetical protein